MTEREALQAVLQQQDHGLRKLRADRRALDEAIHKLEGERIAVERELQRLPK